MTDFLSGPGFGRQIAIRVAIFVAASLSYAFIVVGFLFFVSPLLPEAVARFAMKHGAEIFTAAFALSLIGPCIRRMRSLALPGWWGLFIPALIASDGIGLFWMLVGPFRFLSIHPSTYAYGFVCVAAALALVIALPPAPPPSAGDPGGLARFGFAGKLVGILAVAAVAIAYVDWAVVIAIGWDPPRLIIGSKTSNSPLAAQFYSIHAVLAYAKVATGIPLSALFIWLAVVSRRQGDDAGRRQSQRGDSNSPVPAQQPRGTPRTVFGKR